jgi:hypothetical protein
VIGVASYVVAVVLRDVPDDEETLVYITAGFVVFVIILADEYWTAVRPAKRVQELAPITLDGLVDPLISQLKANGVTARVNLMMMERTWRWLGFRRYFRMKWHKGMENQPDVNLFFPVSYGVSGQCVRDKQPIYAGSEAVGKFSLPGKADKLTRHLEAILSFPVFEPAGKNGMQSGKVLGVLNLDSSTPNAYDLLTGQAVLDQINQVMQTTASIAGRFFN